MADPRFTVRRYIGEGWSVIPIPKGEKGPRVANWQNTTFTEADFGADDNIGVRLGDPSGGLVDVDLDVVEAMRAATQLLLTTGRIHGRPGKPQSHYWFIAPESRSEQFKDVNGDVLVEIRSTGGQTVLPPSYHPSGEQLAWEIDREPGHVDTAGLRASVLHVATVALLARHWPNGARHVCSGLAAGFLAARGLDPAQVERLIRTAAEIAGDNEVEDRARYARDTAQKFSKGDIKVAGGPNLAEHLGDGVVKRLREWYGVGQDSVIDEMNAKHFVVRVGSKDAIGMDDGKRYIFQNPESLRLRYANQKVKLGTRKKKDDEDGSPVYKSKFEIWLEHPGRRDYNTVVFAPPPLVPDPKDLNVWRGFAIQPAEGVCDKFLWHIRHVICSDSEPHYEYLMDLLALGVQLPGLRSEIATVLRGPQGAGKGVFIRTYGELFGDHFVHLDSPEDLTGHFNAHLSGKCVVFADEAFFAGDFSIRGTLKRMITEPTIRITYKGVDSVFEANCIHLFMATNNEWAVPSEAKERRHFVLDVSESKAQDIGYFTAILDELDNGGRAAFLDQLIKRPIDRAALRRIPDSSALREQQTLTLNFELRWWRECLTLGEIFLGEPWPDFLASDQLYQGYLTWCDNMKINRRCSQIELSKRLQKVLGGATSERRSVYTRDHFGRLDTLAGKAIRRGFIMPSLDEGRALFDQETLGKGKRSTWADIRDSRITDEPADERQPGDEDVEF